MNNIQKKYMTEKTNWIEVTLLWCAGIFAAMQFAKFSISYDSLLTVYNVSGASIGVLLSIVGVVGLLFGVVAGILSGHLGYQKVLIGALCIGGVLSLIQSVLPSYSTLLISRIIEGVSHLGLIVAAPTLMLRCSASRHQSLVMGLWGTFFGVAFSVAGWLGGKILSQYGVSELFFAHALFSVPLIVYFLISSSKSKLVNQHTTASILSINTLVTSTIQVYLNPRTCLPGIVFLFHTSMFVALLTFIPRISDDDTTQNFLLISLPLCSIAGTFLAGILSQYCLRPPNLLLVSYAVVAFATFLVISVESEKTLFIYSALFLLLVSGVVQGTSFTLIPFLSKSESELAMGNGAIAQLGNVGATIGPPIFAYFIDINGNYGLLGIVVILCVFGCITALMSRRY